VEYDLFIWVAVGVGSVIAISRFVILPFLKEAGKQNKKAQVVKQEESEELNVKNLTNLAGGAAANYVDNMIKNLEQGYQQAKDIYEKQRTEIAKQNIQPAEAEKILAPLRGKMKQAEWLLQNREGLENINKVMTAPLVGRLAKKILGGFL
jgi:hypothetical protein